MSQISRFAIKFSGESGQGINSAGELLASCLKDAGLYVFGYREYPSLIEGGNASFQVDFSSKALNSTSKYCEILFAVSRYSIFEYIDSIKDGGVIIHSLNNLYLPAPQRELIEKKKIQLSYFDAEQISLLSGAGKKGVNVAMLSLAWRILGMDVKILKDRINRKFGKYPKLIEADLKIVEKITSLSIETLGLNFPDFSSITKEHASSNADDLLVTGNEALALGALSAGVRAMYAYPMTPATSVYKYIADTSPVTKVVIKQAEDEITAVQMALGSMAMGTRALTGTSGGGFDLMTESISFSGMSEIPLVVILAQRPGPSTGLPTWSGAGDLDAAVYSGHGDFARIVVSVSDLESAYIKTQEAFNLAEKYQLPVILLTEKNIAESLYQINAFPKAIKIERNLVNDKILASLKSDDRFTPTKTISPRWLPGQVAETYKYNSDEHTNDGDSTENAEITTLMMDKRLAKLKLITYELPQAEYYGAENPDTIFVGWGSSKSVIVDNLEKLEHELGLKVGYFDMQYLFPLKVPEKLIKLAFGELQSQKRTVTNNSPKLYLIEQNATGQLGKLFKLYSDVKFTGSFYKYDGRPIYYEDLVNFLTTNR